MPTAADTFMQETRGLIKRHPAASASVAAAVAVVIALVASGFARVRNEFDRAVASAERATQNQKRALRSEREAVAGRGIAERQVVVSEVRGYRVVVRKD